jgi:hypothetical protein
MNIPQRWLDVLRALQAAGFTEAFIGGGALRDLDNGQPVKDVDIFIRDRAGCTHGVLMATLPELSIEDCTEFHAEYVTFFPEVGGVYEAFESFDAPPFNIIACAGPEGDHQFLMHHRGRFDLGICRIAHNGHDVYVEKAYNDDKANKTITVLNPRERSQERAERIRDRAYHGWTIVPYAAFDVVA